MHGAGNICSALFLGIRIYKLVLNHTIVQLNLNLHTYTCRHMHVLARLTQPELKNWSVHALLHVFLVCTHRMVNTCNTRVIHVTSSHLICHTIALCGVASGTVAVGNEIQLCCNLACTCKLAHV